MPDVDSAWLYLVGTAGSGKSRLTGAMKRWTQEHKLDAIAVNLDPGAEDLPYQPDVDVREWIQLGDIMAQHGLGPNGAQVVAADMLVLQANEILEVIDEFETDFVLLDTPGQTELFVFRQAGKYLLERLAPNRTAVAFLLDPFLAREPASFVSQMLLAATTQFRFQVPMLHVLSKADLLQEEELERLAGWIEQPALLQDALDQSPQTVLHQLNASVLRLLDDMQATSTLVAASSETGLGIDDVVSFLQNAFAGAEDLATR
jgi:GTPase SAR1 family protein